jgi:hypothetical protein
MLGGGTILRRMRTKSDEDLRWWRHAAKRRYALGSGGWLSFAPQFPKWIERPGIWDEAHVHNAAFAPVHSYALLDEEMRLIPLRFVSRAWRPDVLSLYFEGEFDGSALFVEERRKITPGDAIRSRLRIKGTTGRMLWIVAWTCVPADLELERRKGRYRFRRELQSYRFPAVPVDVEFGGDDFKLLRPRWIQGELPAPDFELTPYFDELPRLPLLESGERIEAPEQLPSRASIVLGCAQRFVLSKERLAVATVETRLRVRTERADAAKVFAPTRHSEFVELLPQLDSDDARVDELYGHRQWLLHFLRVPGGRGTHRRARSLRRARLLSRADQLLGTRDRGAMRAGCAIPNWRGAASRPSCARGIRAARCPAAFIWSRSRARTSTSPTGRARSRAWMRCTLRRAGEPGS